MAMLEQYSKFVTSKYKIVIFLTMTFLLFPVLGLKHIDFSTDYRKFFGGNDKHVKAFDELQGSYAKYDNIMVVIEPEAGNVFTNDVLSVIENATESFWKIPYSTRVDSITNFQNSYSINDELIVEELVKNAESFTPSQLNEIREIATTDPATVNRIVSPKGHVTGINISIKLPDEDLNTAVQNVVSSVRTLADQIKQDKSVRNVYLSGTVMINNAFLEITKDDLLTLMPIMFVLIIFLLILLTQSISCAFATFLIVGLANAFALGVGGWLGIKLTPPSAAAAPIIMTLSIAGCVHLLTTYLKQHQVNDLSRLEKAQMMIISIKQNFMPIALTSLTTVIGFLSMNFADSPPFHDLGNLVAIGIVMAFILTVCFLPALMMVLTVKAKSRMQLGQNSMHLVSEFVVQNRTKVFWLMIGAVVILVMGIPKNELNDEFVKYFDTTVKFRTDNDYITENLTGIYQLEYSIDADEVDGINKTEYLSTLESFANWYREQEHVWHVQSITDVYKKANMNLYAGDKEFYSIPQERNSAAQSLLLYEMSLPIGLDLNDQINVQKSGTKFVVSVYTITANELLELEQKADQWLKSNAPQYMHAIATGPTVLFAHIGFGSIRTGLIGGITALVLISVILSIVFGSIKIGLISLIPNLVPTAMAFGVWGYFYGQINMALATVISMTLGIVVDDTIHFISKYLDAKRQNKNPTEAVHYAFSQVGLAMTITSIVLICGFMVLTFSPFIMNWGMGLLSAITIAFALIADFLLLPPTLIKLEGVRNEEFIPIRNST